MKRINWKRHACLTQVFNTPVLSMVGDRRQANGLSFANIYVNY